MHNNAKTDPLYLYTTYRISTDCMLEKRIKEYDLHYTPVHTPCMNVLHILYLCALI